MIRRALLVAALSVVVLLPASASAYWPYVGYGWYGYGPGWSGWGLNPTNYVPAPPYYAVHPPVYYSSQLTARHYGASPFAWQPGLQPITYLGRPQAAPAPEPQLVENPYVAGARATSQARPGDQATARPMSMTNPYFANAAR
jgi:hypothetical protein